MTDEELERIAANSFRDFHAKGLDYLCLSRAPDVTKKVYFFDEVDDQASEVVAPHDHRYQFATAVLAGRLMNFRYTTSTISDPDARAYERFSYMTPLNGGDGFRWEAEDFLMQQKPVEYLPGSVHSHMPSDLHTIRVTRNTVIYLTQGPDIVPLDQATHCWRPAGQRVGPDLSGLYTPMSVDRVCERLRQLSELRA